MPIPKIELIKPSSEHDTTIKVLRSDVRELCGDFDQRDSGDFEGLGLYLYAYPGYEYIIGKDNQGLTVLLLVKKEAIS